MTVQYCYRSNVNSSNLQELGSKVCPHTGKVCSRRELHRGTPPSASEPLWYAPPTLGDALAVITAHPNTVVKLVAGNTGKGECGGKEWKEEREGERRRRRGEGGREGGREKCEEGGTEGEREGGKGGWGEREKGK